MRHPQVIIRKLGQHKAWGLFDGEIHIDPRTKGRARIEVLLHERLHGIHPDMEEEDVRRTAAILADFLHRNHVRVVEPDKHGLDDL